MAAIEFEDLFEFPKCALVRGAFAKHGSERVADLGRDQIEYVNEDPMVRERFESELDKRGLKTDMPSECYTDPNYVWSYVGYEDQ